MKVWTLMHNTPYEGGDLEGVFATADLAKEAAASQETAYGRLDGEWVQDRRGGWKCYSEFGNWYIAETEVTGT
jgi:hypothetical protein